MLKANQGEAGPGWTDAAIATALKVHPATVARIACGTSPPGWTPRSSARRPRQYRHALDGEQEAHLVALACTFRRRTQAVDAAVRSGGLVELNVVQTLSQETVHQA